MRLSENALVVLKSRYLQKDPDGNIIETPDQLIERVAKAIAKADKNYNADDKQVEKTTDEFIEIMSELKFLPNTPTLVNAGRPLGQLSACFVLPIDDSMESIFDAVKATALIHKSGGGTGFSFSRLRPKNDIVSSTMGVSSGPVSFMKVFDCATEAIKQGGVRRGANMGILRVDHPDILDFIHCKEKEGEFSNFNISVAITDKFLKALENDEEYELINPRNSEVVGRLKASFVWDEIAKGAHKNGEPGIIFIDRINEKHPLSKEVGEIESTNPCGEQPLLPYESCNLGSINLGKFVKDGQINWEDLKRTVKIAVHFLDNVIDVNKYPLDKIEENTKKNRKIGLGVMGFADLLIDLGIPYDSEEAIKTAEEVMKFIQDTSKEASSELAKIRGNFPNYKYSIYAKENIPMRNATTTTIAPTGSISMIADASSGIEPIFALAYYKQVLDGKRLPYVYERLFDALKEKSIYSDSLAEKIIDNRGSLKGIDEIPEDIKRLFVTAMDISYKAHIDIQAAFQKYTDNAVSKTINMANSVTVEDVKEAYDYAYKKGLKGITVYRDGSREEQVLVVPKKEEKTQTKSFSRPIVLNGFTEKVKTSRGTLYVTVNTINGEPIEVFANIGKSGGDISALSEAIGRLISIALQNGVNVKSIINTLISITGAQPIWDKGRLIKSVPDAIAQVLRDHFLRNGSRKEEPKKIVGEECPECGSPLEIVEGCAVCRNCGYSRCG
ncbi:vitamin B12-dependent ribonucleotide reductase [Hippea alviniae]|uniref:vitamin B12-dependent ribonucleotide reductase n=1 Tax=Hippea alviniae TaxID=1279027 RepID=UPI0003B7501E|nr:vitamin B12-dependent ribonucleotide reductase [Hippea alviniae]